MIMTTTLAITVFTNVVLGGFTLPLVKVRSILFRQNFKGHRLRKAMYIYRKFRFLQSRNCIILLLPVSRASLELVESAWRWKL